MRFEDAEFEEESKSRTLYRAWNWSPFAKQTGNWEVDSLVTRAPGISTTTSFTVTFFPLLVSYFVSIWMPRRACVLLP